MRLERLRIEGLRAIQSREDVFKDGEEVWRSFCVRGVNGSGKTTYLEVIGQMWLEFRSVLSKNKINKDSIIYESRNTNIVFSNMPKFIDAPGYQDKINISISGNARQKLSTSPLNTLWWLTSFMISESGTSDPLPNIVYLEAESRWVPEPRGQTLSEPVRSAPWQAVCRYSPQARGADHIEGVMRTLKLARPEKWAMLQEVVAELFPGMTLSDEFDEATQRPMFRLGSGQRLFLSHLSAGERAALINLCTVLRWLAPGGIVLLDEPELHQHLSLMRGSLAALEWLVCDRLDGQLIVASHAPEVWDHFRVSGHIIDLPPPARGIPDLGARQ